MRRLINQHSNVHAEAVPLGHDKKQSGFTIIELMISTTIFSLVLMICMAGILQITKMYYRGVTQTKTREAARVITDEIGEAIRFSNQSVAIGPVVYGPQINDLSANSVGYFCIGQKRYSYAIDRQVKSTPVAGTKQKKHALWVDQTLSCSSAADLNADVPTSNGKDLVPQNMRLYKLAIVEKDAIKNIFSISVGIAYGDNDLLFPKPASSPTELTCEGGFVGVEFCATTNYDVTVQKRLE